MAVVLPPDYIPKTGDVIKSVYRAVNNTGLPIDDGAIATALLSYPVKEVEDRVYQQTGVRIKIRNRRVETISSSREWRHEVEYEIVEAHTPAIVVLAPAILQVVLAVIVILGILLIIDKLDWFLEKNLKVETPVGEIDLRGIFLILLVFAIVVMLLKK